MILTQNLNLGCSQPFLHQYSSLNIIPHTSIHTCLVYSYLDEKIKDVPILLKNKELDVKRVLSNSFGFGGTNACLIFEKPN